MKFKPSTRQDKRLMVQFANGVVVHFGSKNGQTFIDHGDKLKRSNYLTRHGASEDWTDPTCNGLMFLNLLFHQVVQFLI